MDIIEINGMSEEFKFGFGFLRAINEVRTDSNGEKIGLQYRIAQMTDGNPEALLDVLDKAKVNKLLTRKEIEEWLEDPATEIDEVYNRVMDFLSQGNCTRKITQTMLKAIEDEKKKREAAED